VQASQYALTSQVLDKAMQAVQASSTATGSLSWFPYMWATGQATPQQTAEHYGAMQNAPMAKPTWKYIQISQAELGKALKQAAMQAQYAMQDAHLAAYFSGLPKEPADSPKEPYCLFTSVYASSCLRALSFLSFTDSRLAKRKTLLRGVRGDYSPGWMEGLPS